VSSNSDVADFRDAVHLKNSPILTGFASSQLLVYANKAAFDKRNDADEKEEPLEEDSLISDLGKSKKAALIVIVPSPILAELKGIKPCEILIYKHICNAIESDGFLSFGQQDTEIIPSTTLKKLYIRESYKSIASSIMQSNTSSQMHVATSSIIEKPGSIKKAIITGTPGIGKSLFMIYLLHKLVMEGKRVLFIYHPDTIYFDGKGGIFRFPSGDFPLDTDDSFWNDSLWCLFDAKEKNDSDLGRLPYERCNFVLSTSPRRELVNDFKKPPVPQVFYMPTWTETELEAIAPLFDNVTAWRGRFEFLGGIPQKLFEDVEKEPHVILDTACKQFSLDNYIRIVDLDSSITEHSRVIHSLVHITSTVPFTECSVCYASQKAVEIIAEKLEKETKRNLL